MSNIDYTELDRKFGTVTHDGKTYWLTSQAEYSNRVFNGWWGDASEGEQYWTEFDCEAVDDAGNTYRVVWQFSVTKGEEPEPDTHDWDDVARVDLLEEAATPDDADNDDDEPSIYTLVYNHPTLRHYVASHKTPHLDALAKAGLLETLTVDQAAAIVIIAQTAYQNGQRAQGAERIDNDAVWLDGVGGLERQADGTWRLTMPDGGLETMAAELGRRGGSVSSEAKAAAARANDKRGGRPRKNTQPERG